MSEKKKKKQKKGQEDYAVVSGSYNPSEKFEFFDDCPICRALKKAEEEGRSLSEEELKNVFQEANDQNRLREEVKNKDKSKRN